jgi:hypothetical protein
VSERSIFRDMPGYPWLPCPICKQEGFPNATESCDHTVLERARCAHPGLVIRHRKFPLGTRWTKSRDGDWLQVDDA